MRIEIISGSPRQQSVTRRLALALEKAFKATTEHEIGLIDLREHDLPAMQAVFTSIEYTPAPYKKISEKIFNADAFVLVTPEYNGSYSPAMKNLLDHFPKQYHKVFGIATASPGAFGGIRASQHLLQLIPSLFGIASPYLLIVPAVDKKFDETGNLIDPNFEKSIHNFITEFLWLSENIVKQKAAA